MQERFSTNTKSQRRTLKLKNKTTKCTTTRNTVQESDIKGDTVICLQQKQNKLTPRFNPEQLTMTTRKYNMVTAEASNGRTMTRNVSYFKKVDRDASKDEYGDQQTEPEQQEDSVQRSQRICNPVNRYGYNP